MIEILDMLYGLEPETQKQRIVMCCMISTYLQGYADYLIRHEKGTVGGGRHTG